MTNDYVVQGRWWPVGKVSLGSGLKCSYFAWELKVQDREGKGQMGVRPGKMWSNPMHFVSVMARHVTSTQWAGCPSTGDVLRKSCKKEWQLGRDSTMEKEGGIFFCPGSSTCFLWSRDPLLEKWLSTFQGHMLWPWASLKEAGSPPIQDQKWRDDLGWGGLSILGMRVIQVQGSNLTPANPGRLPRAAAKMQLSGPEVQGDTFPEKEATQGNLRGLLFVPHIIVLRHSVDGDGFYIKSLLQALKMFTFWSLGKAHVSWIRKRERHTDSTD